MDNWIKTPSAELISVTTKKMIDKTKPTIAIVLAPESVDFNCFALKTIPQIVTG